MGYFPEKHILIFTDVYSVFEPKGELLICSNLTLVERREATILLCAKFPKPKVKISTFSYFGPGHELGVKKCQPQFLLTLYGSHAKESHEQSHMSGPTRTLCSEVAQKPSIEQRENF